MGRLNLIVHYMILSMTVMLYYVSMILMLKVGVLLPYLCYSHQELIMMKELLLYNVVVIIIKKRLMIMIILVVVINSYHYHLLNHYQYVLILVMLAVIQFNFIDFYALVTLILKN